MRTNHHRHQLPLLFILIWTQYLLIDVNTSSVVQHKPPSSSFHGNNTSLNSPVDDEVNSLIVTSSTSTISSVLIKASSLPTSTSSPIATAKNFIDDSNLPFNPPPPYNHLQQIRDNFGSSVAKKFAAAVAAAAAASASTSTSSISNKKLSLNNQQQQQSRNRIRLPSSSPGTTSTGSGSSLPMTNMMNAIKQFQTDNTCRSNCSGHGDCYNGTCFCEVEYSGGTCDHPNFKYYVSFSTVYYMICVVSFIQLMLCINSEIARQKPRSITRAFRVNIQKALYFFICIATAIRGYYFSSPANGQLPWTESLMSAYYPILMSGSSLLVCFWAEVFHLDASLERSRFLSKSFFGFILFNAISYSLYLAELVLLSFTNPNDTDKGMFLNVFNSIYAFLMFIVVVFFLIYGVEVYFKVRGAFTAADEIANGACSADISQLQQSRLGLISQAVLLLVTIVFMLSEVLGFMWKDKVPVLSRNYHQVMFRVVEFGVALWFPCVLWNCIQPEQLWILNPRRILKRRQSQLVIADEDDEKQHQSDKVIKPAPLPPLSKTMAESEYLVGSGLFDVTKPGAIPECWICYETVVSKPEAGPMIQPCLCRGDVSAVHHSCLLRWLMESCSTSTAPVSCKVCGSAYKVEQSNETVWLPAGLTIAHWLKTATIITVMCCTLAGSIMIVKLFQHMYVKMTSVGSAILVEYICLRFLGFNMISAYHRAKISAIKIIGRKININNNSNNNCNIGNFNNNCINHSIANNNNDDTNDRDNVGSTGDNGINEPELVIDDDEQQTITTNITNTTENTNLTLNSSILNQPNLQEEDPHSNRLHTIKSSLCQQQNNSTLTTDTTTMTIKKQNDNNNNNEQQQSSFVFCSLST